METKNESEKVFEQYLDKNGFQDKWTYEPSIPGKRKRPDYLLNWKGEEHFLEVKELRKKPNEPTWPAYFDPYSSLRSEIDEARRKFKEYKGYSCSLVVFNVDDRQARLDPLAVFGAMLGNLGLKMDYDPRKGEAVAESERNVFLDGGKMINVKRVQPQNTTISAIIVLEEFRDNREIQEALIEEMKKQGGKFTAAEKSDMRMRLYENHHVRNVPRVVVMENPYARVVFPGDLFSGSFDEHWRWREDLSGKIERLFAGNKLKELEELKGKV
ncbi:MAG: hypothetical protein ACYS8I_06250 [Planctomycetota bacterium]|jgi:hypothetical protein